MTNDYYSKILLTVIAGLLVTIGYRLPARPEPPAKPSISVVPTVPPNPDLAGVQFVVSNSFGNYKVFDPKTGEYWHLDGTEWTYIGKITKLGAPIQKPARKQKEEDKEPPVDESK